MDEIRYKVVVNDEEQYSIWAADQDCPAGWTATGVEGTKEECLDHIEAVWTDMRPRSLREAMDRNSAGADDVPGAADRDRAGADDVSGGADRDRAGADGVPGGADRETAET